jgi:Xaa-Pro dipeptidase
MVFTVEPGIYIPGKGGVRLEDDVAVTEGGCRLLSRNETELQEISWVCYV